MNKETLIEMLDNATLWTKDRWGNYKTETKTGSYRIHLKDRVVRLETKVGDQWVKLYSRFITQLTTTEKGSLIFAKNRAIKLN
jgi:hypothetical protein